MGLLSGVPPMEKHELSKIDFELTADKVADLRDMFRDAFTGWLEIDQAA